MNDRKPADKGTDDATGTPDFSDAMRPSHGTAAGANGDAEPGAARGTTDAPAEASNAEARPDPGPAAKPGSAAGGEPEMVSSAQFPEAAAAKPGSAAGGEPEMVSSAQFPEAAAAKPGSAAGGEPETVSSAQFPETTAAKPVDTATAAARVESESARPSAADDSWHDTPIAESVRRATERAEQVQADSAAAAERGASGVPGPVSRPGRTLLEALRDKPVLAAIPASVLAFILWRAFRGR
ncbi:hypothetical protein [Nocardia asiatica]|uniref:hypothetical protein n=1 Tax=Nocardia asiatica TaxID=209252 RepID=UPI0002F69DE4|nr:hypothetical protein [Nocardia asiatica]